MAETTIYCDAEYCKNNEDGFCWADRVHINENGECTEVVKGESEVQDDDER